MSELDGPVGEYPDLPPTTGVESLLRAADLVRGAIDERDHLRAAVAEIRTACDGKHIVSAVGIRNILQRHAV